MLDQGFCNFLERELWKYFANAPSAPVKLFWCDGVLPPFENHCSQKYVNDNRKVVMSAYAGLSGQDLYELILYFGNKSLSRYARGLNITECLPSLESHDHFHVDIERRIISIQLD